MRFKAIAIALSLLAVHSVTVGQEMEKNGLPCVAEICLGDGLKELSKIQWAPAHNPIKLNNKAQATSAHPLSEDDLRALKGTFPEVNDAAPYLHERQFDTAALSNLSRITAACHTNELIGTFGAAGATPTRVGISLLPSAADPAKQAWTVTTIEREFPSIVTNQERARINKELNRKYAKFGAYNSNVGTGTPGEGRFFPSGMTRFGFGLSMLRAPDESLRLKKHPACNISASASSSVDGVKTKAG